jgi:hypothetical protein
MPPYTPSNNGGHAYGKLSNYYYYYVRKPEI